jgi:hypothetical protein
VTGWLNPTPKLLTAEFAPAAVGVPPPDVAVLDREIARTAVAAGSTVRVNVRVTAAPPSSVTVTVIVADPLAPAAGASLSDPVVFGLA